VDVDDHRRRPRSAPAAYRGSPRWRARRSSASGPARPRQSPRVEPAFARVLGERRVRWTESETAGSHGGLCRGRAGPLADFDGRAISASSIIRRGGFADAAVIINIHGGRRVSPAGLLGPHNYYVQRARDRITSQHRGFDGLRKPSRSSTTRAARWCLQDIAPCSSGSARGRSRRPIMCCDGGSYGGHMTLVTAPSTSPICCSVDVVGISNSRPSSSTHPVPSGPASVEYGRRRDSTLRAWMERTPPLNNVDKVQSALHFQV